MSYPETSRPLSTREAYHYLFENYGIRRKPSTLTKLRSIGGGPRYLKAGRAVIYEIAALDDWANDLVSEPMGYSHQTHGFSL